MATTCIAIAKLQPHLSDQGSLTINGITTLIWPYSSSAQCISFLLVEPDFRLRRKCGQVRVQLRGRAAKAFDAARISSGEGLELSLDGVQWIESTGPASTPGRGIGWEILFDHRLRLLVKRSGQDDLLIDISSETTKSPAESSPIALSPQPAVDDVPPMPQHAAAVFSSPAFLRRTRMPSLSELDTAYDSTEFLDNGRHKRIKFGQKISQWRLSEDMISPKDTIQTQSTIIDDSIITTEQPLKILAKKPDVLQNESIIATTEATDLQSEPGPLANMPTPEPAITSPESITAQFEVLDQSTLIAAHKNDEHDSFMKYIDPDPIKSFNSQIIPPLHMSSDTSHSSLAELTTTDSVPIDTMIDPALLFHTQQETASRTLAESPQPHDSIQVTNDSRPYNILQTQLSLHTEPQVEPSPKGATTPKLHATSPTELPVSQAVSEFLPHELDDMLTPKLGYQSFETPSVRDISQSPRAQTVNEDFIPLEVQTREVQEEIPQTILHQKSVVLFPIEQQREIQKDDPVFGGHGIPTMLSGEQVMLGEALETTGIARRSVTPTTERRGEALDVEGESISDENQIAAFVVKHQPEAREEPHISNANATCVLAQKQDILAPALETTNDRPNAEELAPPLVETRQERQKIMLGKLVQDVLPGASLPTSTKSSLVDHSHDASVQIPNIQQTGTPQFNQGNEGVTDEHKNVELNESEVNDGMGHQSFGNVDNGTLGADVFNGYRDPSRREATKEQVLPDLTEEQVARQERTRESSEDATSEEESIAPKAVSSRSQEESGLAENDCELAKAEKGDQIPELQVPKLVVAKSSQSDTPQESTGDPAEPTRIAPNDVHGNDSDLRYHELSGTYRSDVLKVLEGNSVTGEDTQNGSQFDASVGDRSQHRSAEKSEIVTESQPLGHQIQEKNMPPVDKTRNTQIQATDAITSSSTVNTPRDVVENIELPLKDAGLAEESAHRNLAPSTTELGTEAETNQSDMHEVATAIRIAKIEPFEDKNVKKNSTSSSSKSQPSSGSTFARRYKRHVEELERIERAKALRVQAQSQEKNNQDEVSEICVIEQGLRTSHSYFSALSTLSTHYGSTIDILAVVVEASPVQRANAGARDHYTTLYLSDGSIAADESAAHEPSLEANTIATEVLHRKESVLPRCSAGDVILLRDFKVSSRRNTIFLLSTVTSAWTVFRGHNQLPDTRGPPVEYAAEEADYAKSLSFWWSTETVRGQRARLGSLAAEEIAASVARNERAAAALRRKKAANKASTGMSAPDNTAQLNYDDSMQDGANADTTPRVPAIIETDLFVR